MRKVLIVVAVAGCALGLFYFAFVNHNEAYEAGITWNYATGEIALQNRAGYHLTAPWVQVSHIDTRPARVCITSATRAFNCKLVQFEPSAYREFVSVQGFHYYWWANRVSFNWGYIEEYRGVRDLLRGYAFSVKKYPFITVLRDYAEQ